jgi:hypothetical protein
MDAHQDQSVSPGQKFVLIFTDPAKVFSDNSGVLNWLLPLLVVLVLSFGSGFLTHDYMVDYQKELIEENQRIPEEQKAQILDSMEERMSSPVNYAIGIVAFFVISLLISGVFLFTGNFILGGKASFTENLSVYAWGLMVAIPEVIIKTPLIMAKESVKVYLSLASLFPASESNTLLFKLADAVDIFRIWNIVLWGIGMAVIYKMPRQKATVAVSVLYLLWIAVSIGFTALTQGF